MTSSSDPLFVSLVFASAATWIFFYRFFFVINILTIRFDHRFDEDGGLVLIGSPAASGAWRSRRWGRNPSPPPPPPPQKKKKKRRCRGGGGGVGRASNIFGPYPLTFFDAPTGEKSALEIEDHGGGGGGAGGGGGWRRRRRPRPWTGPSTDPFPSNVGRRSGWRSSFVSRWREGAWPDGAADRF